ncbi:MAG: hypothetical protein KF901_22970 [Myxococcales bacterium]|nr:hypothetical protein [Myxococcales bacterium]
MGGGRTGQRRKASWWVVAFAVAAACGGDDEEVHLDGSVDAGAVEPVTLTSYCERRAASYYEFLARCFGDDLYTEARRESFTAEIAARCQAASGAVEAGRLRYDGFAAARCLDAVRAPDCVTSVDPRSCREVFEGLVEPGGACWPEESIVFLVGVSACREGYCADTASCPGTCARLPGTGEPCPDGACPRDHLCSMARGCLPLPGPGEPCLEGNCRDDAACAGDTCRRLATSPDDACGDEVVCRPPISICVRGTCRARVEAGEACRLAVHCPDGTICRDGTCLARALEGEPCAADVECAPGLFCPFEGRTCARVPSIGEPCPDLRCTSDASCWRFEDDDELRCRARVGLGGDCADGFDLCAEGTYCSAARICEGEGALGESCWAVRPCAEGLGCRCTAREVEACATSQQDDGDTCQPLVADGGPCFNYIECASRDCDLEVSTGPAVPGQCRAGTPPVCLP